MTKGKRETLYCMPAISVQWWLIQKWWWCLCSCISNICTFKKSRVKNNVYPACTDRFLVEFTLNNQWGGCNWKGAESYLCHTERSQQKIWLWTNLWVGGGQVINRPTRWSLLLIFGFSSIYIYFRWAMFIWHIWPFWAYYLFMFWREKNGKFSGNS